MCFLNATNVFVSDMLWWDEAAQHQLRGEKTQVGRVKERRRFHEAGALIWAWNGFSGFNDCVWSERSRSEQYTQQHQRHLSVFQLIVLGFFQRRTSLLGSISMKTLKKWHCTHSSKQRTVTVKYELVNTVQLKKSLENNMSLIYYHNLYIASKVLHKR